MQKNYNSAVNLEKYHRAIKKTLKTTILSFREIAFDVDVRFVPEHDVFAWVAKTSIGEFLGHVPISEGIASSDVENDARMQIALGITVRKHPAGDFMYRALTIHGNLGEPDFFRAMALYVAVEAMAVKLSSAMTAEAIEALPGADQLVQDVMDMMKVQTAELRARLVEGRLKAINALPVQDS